LTPKEVSLNACVIDLCSAGRLPAVSNHHAYLFIINNQELPMYFNGFNVEVNEIFIADD